MAQLQQFALTGNQITEEAFQDTGLTRTVKDREGNTVATLTADAYAGLARINYEAIIRTLFEDSLASVVSGAYKTNMDRNLHAEANINNQDYVFVRGVSQVEESDTPATWRFLVTMPFLRWYKGFPLTISHLVYNDTRTYWAVMINGDYFETNEALVSLASVTRAHITTDIHENPNMETVVLGDADYVTIHQGDRYDFWKVATWRDENGRLHIGTYWRLGLTAYYVITDARNPKTGDTGYYMGRLDHTYDVEQVHYKTETRAKTMQGTIALENGGVLYDSIQVQVEQVPEHPFYVRWINNRGGWDYFMFACDHKQALALTTNATYEKNGARGVRTAYNKAAQRTIEVSSGVVDHLTLESLAELISAPVIQYYKLGQYSGTWIDIQVQDAKPEIYASQTTGEMLFTFELPTPQMNK